MLRGQFLTKLIGYRESIVLIIHTKNASNLTIMYQDMVPGVQNVWMDIKTDDAKTISLQHNTPDPLLSAVNEAFTNDMTVLHIKMLSTYIPLPIQQISQKQQSRIQAIEILLKELNLLRSRVKELSQQRAQQQTLEILSIQIPIRFSIMTNDQSR